MSLDHAGLAAELFAAEQERSFVELFTQRFADFGWDDARAIAREVDQLRSGSGDTQVGWKLGWTSAAMREALGISRPNWGTLWESQRVNEPTATLRMRQAKVEPELVYVAGADLDELSTLREIADTAAGWCFGIEFVDPRFPSFEFEWLDNTADNSSASGFAIGEIAPLDDPAAVTLLFEKERFEKGEEGDAHFHGAGTQAMGNPIEAVSWLCRSLGDEGLNVRAGDIVFTGGLTAPFDVEDGVMFRVISDDGRPASFTASA